MGILKRALAAYLITIAIGAGTLTTAYGWYKYVRWLDADGCVSGNSLPTETVAEIESHLSNK